MVKIPYSYPWHQKRFYFALIGLVVFAFMPPVLAQNQDYRSPLKIEGPLPSSESGIHSQPYAPSQTPSDNILKNRTSDPAMLAYQAGDYKRAFTIWLSQAQNGAPIAQANIAHMYRLGQAVPKNAAIAAEWYDRAAHAGHIIAQYNLASLYRDGVGVKRDLQQAAYWFEKAALKGDVPSMLDLADILLQGLIGQAAPEEAFRWYAHAARLNSVKALYELARLHHLGEGTEINLDRAVSLYQAAGEAGHAGAQYNLGLLYETGTGLPRNLEEAGRWYRRAAHQGIKLADRRLIALEKKRVRIPYEALPAAEPISSAIRIPPPKPNLHRKITPKDENTAPKTNLQKKQGNSDKTLMTSWRLRLASYRSQDLARMGWTQLQQKYPGFLNGKDAIFPKIDLGPKGIFFRLEVGPFKTPKQAQQACQHIIRQGDGCLVLKP